MAKATPDLIFQASKFGPGFLVFVMETEGQYHGFVSLIPRENRTIELYDLFVHPAMMGQALGTLLFRHAVETARALDYLTLVLTADPHAEGFYVEQGAVRSGHIASPIEPGRLLPRMEYQIRGT